MGPRGRRAAGFTVVELIITVGISAIAIVGLVQLFVCSLWQTESAGRFSTAASEAYGKWEEIHGADFDGILADYGPGGAPGDTFALQDVDGRGVIFLDGSTPGLIAVDIVVSWRDRGNQVVGEDQNLNGRLDAGEDENLNGRLDSPVSLSSLVARR